MQGLDESQLVSDVFGSQFDFLTPSIPKELQVTPAIPSLAKGVKKEATPRLDMPTTVIDISQDNVTQIKNAFKQKYKRKRTYAEFIMDQNEDSLKTILGGSIKKFKAEEI